MGLEKVAEISIGSPTPEGSLTQTWGVLQYGRGPVASNTPAFEIVEIIQEKTGGGSVNTLHVKDTESGLTPERLGNFIVEQIQTQSTRVRIPGEELAKISLGGYAPKQKLTIVQSLGLYNAFTLIETRPDAITDGLTPETLGSAIVRLIMRENPQNGPSHSAFAYMAV